MRSIGSLACVLGMLICAAYAADSKSTASDDRNTIVIVFKDGRQQSFSLADIARVEFRTSTAHVHGSSSGMPVLGKNHFVGKWRVGDGSGSDFYITLSPDGDARKSIGAIHGTWSVVDGEAQIIWDDGWHDAIRQVGSKHEKFAYAPGKSFSDPPSNVTNAVNTQAKPI